MRLGVLSWKKLKWNRGTHGRIVSLDQLGGRRAIADLFVMFIAWTSQKSSNVHKLLSQSWPYRLIWNIQSAHELRQLIVLWKVQTHNIKLDTMHTQHFLIAERERSIFNTCRFDIGGFRAEPTDYESVHTWVIHSHIAVPRITCSLRYA